MFTSSCQPCKVDKCGLSSEHMGLWMPIGSCHRHGEAEQDTSISDMYSLISCYPPKWIPPLPSESPHSCCLRRYIKRESWPSWCGSIVWAASLYTRKSLFGREIGNPEEPLNTPFLGRRPLKNRHSPAGGPNFPKSQLPRHWFVWNREHIYLGKQCS